MKKIIILLVILSSLASCTVKKEDFPSYMNSLIKEIYSPKSLSMNLSFNNLETFDLKPELYELGFETKDDYIESIDKVKKIIKELKSFRNLKDQELLDQKASIAYFEDLLKRYDYHDFEYGENLNLNTGFIFNIANYLEVYEFKNAHELEAYFNFIHSFEKDIYQYLDLERERQKRNTGFGQQEIDKMQSHAQSLVSAIKEDDYFLKVLFKEKIDAVTFEVDEDILDKHNSLMNDVFASTYELIADELSLIKAKESRGLASKPEGKAYYNMLLNEYLGKKVSVNKYFDMLVKEYNKGLRKLSTFDDSYFETYLNADYYHDYGSGEKTLDYLYVAMQLDFPKIDAVNFEMRRVDESNSEASAPAYYFTPKVDAKEEDLQYIYINGPYDKALYPTYAHEGYPGHMYQLNYLRQLNMHPLRYMLSTSATIEGWAKYAENYSLSYITDQTLYEFITEYTYLIEMAHMILDMGVNYYDWDMTQFEENMMNLGLISEDESVEQLEASYLSFVMSPGDYVKYYGTSMEIRNMAKQYRKKGKSDLEFHTDYLDVGATSLRVIKEALGLK